AARDDPAAGALVRSQPMSPRLQRQPNRLAGHDPDSASWLSGSVRSLFCWRNAMTEPRARDMAVSAITNWPVNGRRAPRSTTSIRQLFGVNVFSDEVMKARLPENVYKALRNTLKKGAPLDSSIADVVAATMREWAMERGATHFTHWFQP